MSWITDLLLEEMEKAAAEEREKSCSDFSTGEHGLCEKCRVAEEFHEEQIYGVPC